MSKPVKSRITTSQFHIAPPFGTPGEVFEFTVVESCGRPSEIGVVVHYRDAGEEVEVGGSTVKMFNKSSTAAFQFKPVGYVFLMKLFRQIEGILRDHYDVRDSELS